jgi:membrane protease YdiL (CAAX protease family)
MPNEVRDKAENVRLYLNFLVDALILGFVATLMLRNSVPAARVGLHLGNWKSNTALGVTAGILLIVLQSLMTKRTRSGPSETFAYHVRRGSVLLWVLIFIAGAFSEELWIAFCLVALMANGLAMPLSVAITAVVFGAVHYGYRLGVIAVALKGTISALLFLWSGSLIPSFLYHFIGNLSSLYLARRGIQ